MPAVTNEMRELAAILTKNSTQSYFECLSTIRSCYYNGGTYQQLKKSVNEGYAATVTLEMMLKGNLK